MTKTELLTQVFQYIYLLWDVYFVFHFVSYHGYGLFYYFILKRIITASFSI